MFHLPCVYLKSIDKTLTVDRVLYRMEKEEFVSSKKEKTNKEYITWN